MENCLWLREVVSQPRARAQQIAFWWGFASFRSMKPYRRRDAVATAGAGNSFIFGPNSLNTSPGVFMPRGSLKQWRSATTITDGKSLGDFLRVLGRDWPWEEPGNAAAAQPLLCGQAGNQPWEQAERRHAKSCCPRNTHRKHLNAIS